MISSASGNICGYRGWSLAKTNNNLGKTATKEDIPFYCYPRSLYTRGENDWVDSRHTIRRHYYSRPRSHFCLTKTTNRPGDFFTGYLRETSCLKYHLSHDSRHEHTITQRQHDDWLIFYTAPTGWLVNFCWPANTWRSGHDLALFSWFNWHNSLLTDTNMWAHTLVLIDTGSKWKEEDTLS